MTQLTLNFKLIVSELNHAFRRGFDPRQRQFLSASTLCYLITVYIRLFIRSFVPLEFVIKKHIFRAKKVFLEISEHFGGIDILINNAGISRFAPIDNDDYEIAWHESIAVLLTAHTLTIRAALPHLRKANNPRIVNIASTEGLGATRYGSPYTAAKTGVIGLTRSLAVELGPEKITVNCVCPGPINTGMTSTISEEDKAVFARRRTALRRYAEPEEVAHGTLGLVLPASQYITGATLPVDGGLTIRNA